MSLSSKLSRWQQAGLIDAATREKIEAFEHGQRKPVVLYALAVLGASTVALGIVSIVAANWDAIPGGVKIGVDLALYAALAAATYAVQRRQALAAEVLVTVLYGFTLASLALVGQVYRLDTPTWQALLLWSLSTLPLVLLGQSRYLAALIVAGLATTHGYVLEAIFEQLERELGENLIATLLAASPFLYVVLGRVPWLVRERPEYAWVLSIAAWAAVLFAAFALQFVWYDDLDPSDTLGWAVIAIAVVCGAVAGLVQTQSEWPLRARRTMALALGFVWLTLAIGTAVPHPQLDYVGALLQLAVLGLAAWISVQLGMIRLFNLLTGAIALRVLVIYFEVFGSLLSTGVGLVTGGALTLLLAYFWRNRTRRLAEHMRAREAA